MGIESMDRPRVWLPCPWHAFDGKPIRAFHLEESQEFDVTSDGCLFSVNGASLVLSLLPQPGEKVQNTLAGDLLLFMFMEESGKEVEIALVCINSRGLVVEGGKSELAVFVAMPVEIGQGNSNSHFPSPYALLGEWERCSVKNRFIRSVLIWT